MADFIRFITVSIYTINLGPIISNDTIKKERDTPFAEILRHFSSRLEIRVRNLVNRKLKAVEQSLLLIAYRTKGTQNKKNSLPTLLVFFLKL